MTGDYTPAEREDIEAAELRDAELDTPSSQYDDRGPVQLPLKLNPIDDLIDGRLPEREYAISPYLPRGEVALVTALGGLGKTSLIFSVGCDVASGRTGVLGTPEKAGVVAFISTEDGALSFQSKVRAWLADVPIAERAEADRLLRKNLRFLAREQAADITLTCVGFGQVRPKETKTGTPVGRIINVTDWLAHLCRGAVLVVLETVSDLHGGQEDNPGLRIFGQELARLARKTDAAVVAIHHVSRTDGRSGATDGSRGGTALPNKCRSWIAITKAKRKDSALLVTHQKFSYGKPAETVAVRTVENAHGLVFRAERVDLQIERDAAALHEHLRNLSDGVTKSELHNEPPCGLTAKRAQAAMQHLVATERATATEEVRGRTKQRATVYRAAADAPELE